MRMTNPSGASVKVAGPTSWLWVLLFGSLYFLVKGMLGHMFISAIIAVFTFGISWLIYPFFTYRIIKNHYIHKGWADGPLPFAPTPTVILNLDNQLNVDARHAEGVMLEQGQTAKPVSVQQSTEQTPEVGSQEPKKLR